MRILQIACGGFFSTFGGGQVYVKNIVDCMIDMGLDVAVVSWVSTIKELNIKEYRGHAIYEIPSPTEQYITEAIHQYSPDVIHTHCFERLICAMGHSMHIPVVVTSHYGGILCPALSRLNCKNEICHTKLGHKNCLPCVLRNTRTGLRYWYPVMRLLPRRLYVELGLFLKNRPFMLFITPIGMAASQIENKINEWEEIASKCIRMIAPCDDIAQAMVQNGLDVSKVVVLPHGITLPENRPEFPSVIDGHIKFYYVGRILNGKGIDVLLKAFSQIKSLNIELHLIGEAAKKSERQFQSNLQNQYHNDTRIVWHGKIPPEKVFEATREFHVACSPSLIEAFGLNIAEALALGKPVLATRSGGGEMQIEDGVNGWLVPTNDVKALADKIQFIVDNPGILPLMSQRCHAESVQAHCVKLIDVYKTVCPDEHKSKFTSLQQD